MTPETTIISNSNLSRPELLAMRRDKFEEGTHWRRNKSRRGRIEWTSAGVEGLADETGVEIGDLLRIEDDVLVTSDGNEVLTASLPVTAEEIESLVGSIRD